MAKPAKVRPATSLVSGGTIMAANQGTSDKDRICV